MQVGRIKFDTAVDETRALNISNYFSNLINHIYHDTVIYTVIKLVVLKRKLFDNTYVCIKINT